MAAGEGIGAWCENVTVSPAGSTFDLHVREKGSIRCQTKLLGEHNILNILMAAAVASDLGLSLRQISHGVSKLAPVKSRLELIAPPNSFTIINDAFNSNPAGAKAALRVLAQFPARRIVITPGMVELGEREAEYNRAFGQDIAGRGGHRHHRWQKKERSLSSTGCWRPGSPRSTSTAWTAWTLPPRCCARSCARRIPCSTKTTCPTTIRTHRRLSHGKKYSWA